MSSSESNALQFFSIRDTVLVLLSAKADCDVSTPRGAQKLRDEIERVTGERLALNTVKRLTGVIDYDFTPRESTLNIMAAYLGFASWESLSEYCTEGLSGFTVADGFIHLPSLAPGVGIAFTWEPDRRLLLRIKEDGTVEVEKSINGKLREGDVVDVTNICQGFPFIAHAVYRDGVNLGRYVAAKEAGIGNVEITD